MIVAVCTDVLEKGAQAGQGVGREIDSRYIGAEFPYFTDENSRALSIFISQEESGSRKKTPDTDLQH